jgi:aspartate carbamoyltransferase catalytic subunit
VVSPMSAVLAPAGLAHLTSTRTLTPEHVEAILDHAEWIREHPQRASSLLSGRILGVLFYQNSTRTRLSFEAAMHRLGGSTIGFADAQSTRAGDFFQETLLDTVRVVGGYVDALAIRHPSDTAAEDAAAVSPVPILNAGDGAHEHPTQALLDVWMARRLLGSLEGAQVGLIGDPDCRDFRSLIFLLATMGAGGVILLPSPGTSLSDDETVALERADMPVRVVDDIVDLLAAADIAHMLPVVLPDFHVGTVEPVSERRVDERYRLTRDKVLAAGIPVLHVGPRGEELPEEVDGLELVHYFDQARHGVPLRGALLHHLIARSDDRVR